MAREDAHMKTLDEVKDQIEPILKQQKAQEIAPEAGGRSVAGGHKTGLGCRRRREGVPVTTSDFFSRKDMVPGLGPAPQFMDGGFHSGGEIAAADGGNIARLRCLRFAGGETAIDANL